MLSYLHTVGPYNWQSRRGQFHDIKGSKIKVQKSSDVKIPLRSQYSGIAAAHPELQRAYDIIRIGIKILTMGTIT